MPSIQNVLGRNTEQNVAEFFKKYYYWAFIIPKKIGGQPFDIIARKENSVWFIDAKHLEKDKASFPFDRIEPNQITSMNYAYKFANIKEKMGFIIEWERTQSFYFFDFLSLKGMIKEGAKSIKIEKLVKLEEIL